MQNRTLTFVAVALLATVSLFSISCKPSGPTEVNPEALRGFDRPKDPSRRVEKAAATPKYTPPPPAKPLAEEDIQIFLKVMSEAAAKVKDFSPADKALLEKYVAMSKGGEELPADQINHAMELTRVDEKVATDMGNLDQYQKARDQIEGLLLACRACSGDSDPNINADQKHQAEIEAERLQKDLALLDQHHTEIIDLERIVHPNSPQALTVQ